MDIRKQGYFDWQIKNGEYYVLILEKNSGRTKDMCSLSRKDYGQMFKWTPLALILGFVIDLLLGDPRWLYHPVRVIGKEISFLEKKLRGIFPKTPQGERQAGTSYGDPAVYPGVCDPGGDPVSGL